MVYHYTGLIVMVTSMITLGFNISNLRKTIAGNKAMKRIAFFGMGLADLAKEYRKAQERDGKDG